MGIAAHIHEGGIPTDEAKDLAAQAQGFRNQAHYWAWLRVYVYRKRLGSGPDQNQASLPERGAGHALLFFAKMRWVRGADFKLNCDAALTEWCSLGAPFLA